MFWRYVFILYLFLVLRISGVSVLDSTSAYLDTISSGNVIFSSYEFASDFNIFLNIIVFLPFGFLLPLIWKKFRNYQLTIFLGFVFSLTVGYLKMFQTLPTGIDDLILNTGGTIVGFVFWHFWQGIVKRESLDIDALGEYEPLVYIFLTPIIISLSNLIFLLC